MESKTLRTLLEAIPRVRVQGWDHLRHMLIHDAPPVANRLPVHVGRL